jgi:FlaA1/EpsC-like NDP-sugar epimerase
VLFNLIIRLRRPIVVVLHIALIAMANLGAFWLRFDGAIPEPYWNVAVALMPWLVGIRLVTFIPFRLFEGLWRYTSLWDVRRIMLAVATSTAAFIVVATLVAPQPSYPRSIPLIDSLLLVFMLVGVRMSRRVYRDFARQGEGRRVLVYGAGDAGEMIVRDMRQNLDFGAVAVGFVDDDPSKKGERIHGIPVLGSRADLGKIIKMTMAEEVLIATPSASVQVRREIVRSLEPFRVAISTLPPLSGLMSKSIGVEQIRRLQLEDLLARDPVAMDYEPVQRLLRGKRVLVTGAAGSVGSELCRQIANAEPANLILIDRYENTLHDIRNELRDCHPAMLQKVFVADVTDATRIDHIFSGERPQVVFHAAAHKHVPLMEENPCEAIKNNVGGTRIVAAASARYGVGHFVLISTDKAVNPTSVMGAAKRVCELLVNAYGAASDTQFSVVRFGNVLGSNGSVVPRFLAQIANGGPVTVTHPEMRRYFMLLPEAVQLVLHAAAIDARGAVFVLEMGEQIRVVDMARDLIRLSGFVPDRDIEIVFTGMRPGEKISEELVGTSERIEPSGSPKIMKVTGNVRVELDLFLKRVGTLEAAALAGLDENVIQELVALLPDYVPNRELAEQKPVQTA